MTYDYLYFNTFENKMPMCHKKLMFFVNEKELLSRLTTTNTFSLFFIVNGLFKLEFP